MSPDLKPLTDGFASTRDDLHQIAFFAVAPKRYANGGRLGLRALGSGFGTPTFGDDEQVLVEGTRLIWRRGEQQVSVVISTVEAAAVFLGISYESEWFADFHDPLVPSDPTAPLNVSGEASRQLGVWFSFATSVLNEARRIEGAEDVSEVQLWPEHFDPAMEIGSFEKGHKASYGGSPGDGNHAGPYLYVAAWGEIDRGNPYWNDEHFNGASLGYQELLDSDDPAGLALDFLVKGYRVLSDG